MSLGIKFHFEQTILSFWAKKGCLISKPKTGTSPHRILHIGISLSTNFLLKVAIVVFWTKFAKKGIFGLKQQR